MPLQSQSVTQALTVNDEMKQNPPTPASGDLYLLFQHLPYDFAEDLPVYLGPGVCMDNTPQSLLDSAEKGLADFLLPGYNLPGMGLNNCCLRSYPSHNLESLRPENLVFIALLCLRLQVPLQIQIGGQFRLGEDKDPIQEPSLYYLSSPWGINGLRYTPSAIEKSSAIMERVLTLKQLCADRLIAALILFSQVTLGQSKSFQLSHLGLFSALEALFVPSGDKGFSLSKRISAFLRDFDFPDPIDGWVKSEYIKGRHKLAHGIHDATFDAKLRPERYQAFGRLHEITRLALLGFLSMESEALRELSRSSGRTLQKLLDSISTASGVFLEEQKFWAG